MNILQSDIWIGTIGHRKGLEMILHEHKHSMIKICNKTSKLPMKWKTSLS